MNKLFWHDVKNVLKRYCLIIIPFMAIVVFLYSYINSIEIEKTKEIIIEEQKQKTTMINYVIQDIFSEFYEDLLVVKNANEVDAYLNDPSTHHLTEVEQLFLRLAESKENFDQIRMIDNNGQEVVRVNHADQIPEIVEKKNLQNKKDRYYYTETSQLAQGEMYVSNMDLNIENGEIEQPYKPMIRMATPLYSSDNKYQGILIINYCGQDLLDLFNQYFKENKYQFIKPNLINQDGYYLYNDDQEKTFGFMFEDKENISLQKENPLLWKDILSDDRGLYEENNDVTYYYRLNPLSLIDATVKVDYFWIIVSSFDSNYLPSIQDSVVFGMKKFDLIIVAGINLLVLILVMVNYYSRKDKQQLSITTKIAQNTNDAVIITNEETKIIYANKAFEKATQYKPEEVLGLKPSYFKSNKQSKEFYQKMWYDIEHQGYWQGELWDRKKDGLLYPKKLSIYKTKDKFSQQVRYIGIFSDMTKIKEGENDLEKLKNYHYDTNLPNENLMFRLIDNSIQDKDSLYIIYFTIENYNQWMVESKDSNEFVKILTDHIKSNLTEEDFMAQVTKNGFVIGLASATTVSHLETFIQKIIYNNTLLYKNNELFFDLKAGISVFPDDGREANDLILNAYLALENVMQTKEKKYDFFKPSFKTAIKNELEMNQLLRKAIQNNELEVHYQPQIQISDEKLVGAEALIRWNSTELGCVSPNVFIPLAEKTGYIIEIGRWLIEQVILDYTKIRQFVSKDFQLSINLSPIQFRDKKLFETFTEFIEKYKVNPRRFEIEITEGVFVKDPIFVNNKLNQFKQLGMSIAIDDFGTGFSSLSYLKELNIDKLKIDRSFIKDYPNADNGVMAQIITNLGNQLGLKVITEGAETIEQVKYLESIGCQLIQGYYYSRPLPMERFKAYIIEKSNGNGI